MTVNTKVVTCEACLLFGWRNFCRSNTERQEHSYLCYKKPFPTPFFSSSMAPKLKKPASQKKINGTHTRTVKLDETAPSSKLKRIDPLTAVSSSPYSCLLV